MNHIVAVAGSIASGKSDLTRELARRWSCPRASFGSLVAEEATRLGRSADRDALQRLGSELIAELGWLEFCRQTLALAGADWTTDSLVIDGIRHVGAIETLRSNFASSDVILVFVSCNEEVRMARQLARGATAEQIQRWNNDATEQSLITLHEMANIRVRGDRATSDAVAVIEAAISRAP